MLTDNNSHRAFTHILTLLIFQYKDVVSQWLSIIILYFKLNPFWTACPSGPERTDEN